MPAPFSPLQHGRALAEALDPRTPPERLVQLSVHPRVEVGRAAVQNPNLLTKELRARLVAGSWDAWVNPATDFLLFEEPGAADLALGAMTALISFGHDRIELVPRLGATLVPVLDHWWQTVDSLAARMEWLGKLGRYQGERSPEHMRAVRAAWHLVRQAVPLAKDRRKDMDHLVTMVECWLEGETIAVEEMIAEGRRLTETTLPEGGVAWTAQHHAILSTMSLTRACLLGKLPRGGRSDEAADAPRAAVMLAATARDHACGADNPDESAHIYLADQAMLRHLFPRCPMRAPFERLDAVDHPPPHPLPG